MVKKFSQERRINDAKPISFQEGVQFTVCLIIMSLKDSIVVLTLIAWTATVTSASMVSYDLQVRVWHTVHAFIVMNC